MKVAQPIVFLIFWKSVLMFNLICLFFATSAPISFWRRTGIDSGKSLGHQTFDKGWYETFVMYRKRYRPYTVERQPDVTSKLMDLYSYVIARRVLWFYDLGVRLSWLIACRSVTVCLSWESGSLLLVDDLLRRSAGTDRRCQNHCATDTPVLTTSATHSAMNNPPRSPRFRDPSFSTADWDRADDDDVVALLHSRRTGHHLWRETQQ